MANPEEPLNLHNLNLSFVVADFIADGAIESTDANVVPTEPLEVREALAAEVAEFREETVDDGQRLRAEWMVRQLVKPTINTTVFRQVTLPKAVKVFGTGLGSLTRGSMTPQTHTSSDPFNFSF